MTGTRLTLMILCGVLAATASVAPGCSALDVEPRDEDRSCSSFRGAPGDRGLVVTSTAYTGSTVVSLLSWDGETKTTSLWSSARRSPGLATALSDDVGATLTPDARGDVALFDRSTGVLSWISPTTCSLQVETQSGNEGLDPNPYDVVSSLPLGRTFVARFGERADGSDGGDILVLGADRRSILDKIPLRSFVTDAEPTARPSPARLLLVGDRLFALLQGFFGGGSGFEHAVEATLVEINASTLAPTAALRLPNIKNCGALIADGDRRLLLACSGVLDEDRPARLAASALVTVNLDEGKMSLGVIVPAASSVDQSFKPVLALLPSGRVIAAGYGDGSASSGRDTRDRWFTLALDPADPAPADVLEVPPYEIGDVACRGAVCWGADASGGGRMRRFEERAGIVTPAGEIVLDPALPPRSLGRF